MRLALDTSRYVDFMRGVPDAVTLITQAARVFVPLFTIAELRAGFAPGAQLAQNERVLTAFLARRSVEVLRPDESTAHVWAGVYAELRRAGRMIPTNDLWIAALCIQHNLPLYTRDRHYDGIPRLARV